MKERSDGMENTSPCTCWVALWVWRALLALVSGAAAYRIGTAGCGADLMIVLFGIVMIQRVQPNAKVDSPSGATAERR